MADIENIDLPEFYWVHLLYAATLAQLGESERAAQSIARLKALKPDFSARNELEKFNTAPDDLEHLMEGLAKAGLKE